MSSLSYPVVLVRLKIYLQNSITYQAHLFGKSCQFVNLCAVQLCIHNVKVTLPLHSSGVKGETSPLNRHTLLLKDTTVMNTHKKEVSLSFFLLFSYNDQDGPIALVSRDKKSIIHLSKFNTFFCLTERCLATSLKASSLELASASVNSIVKRY